MTTPRFIGLDTLDVRYIDGKEIIVRSPVFGFVDSRGREVMIRQAELTPGSMAGFVSDGGTVPRAFQSIVNPFGVYLPAFLVHDFDWSFRVTDRAGTNETLRDALTALGCPRWECTSIIAAVSSWTAGRVWEKGKAQMFNFQWHYAPLKPYAVTLNPLNGEAP